MGSGYAAAGPNADRPESGACAFSWPLPWVDGELISGEDLPLCWLRYSDSASLWGFAITLANKDGYQDSILLSGLPIGAAEAALDTACGLSSTGLSAWS